MQGFNRFAQVRLHDGGLAEGEADVEFTLQDVDVPLDTEAMLEQIKQIVELLLEQLQTRLDDRRITLEVCITSNLQTMPQLRRVEDHPFGRMVEDRLSVSLCTDNRLVSDTTVTRELRLATDAFNINAAELRRVILHGFKRSFYPGSYRDKRNYVRQVIDVYDRVAAKHGLPAVDRAQHS